MPRIILLGTGSAGKALVEFFHGQANIEIVGVADQDEGAAGLPLARDLGLPVTIDYQQLLGTRGVDFIVDVTGDPGVAQMIHKLKARGTEVIGDNAARFIWEFVEATNKTEALEDKYQLAELEARESEFIIGDNPKMKEISELTAKVAPTPLPCRLEAEHLPIHVQDLPGFRSQKGFMASKSLAIEQFERQALATPFRQPKATCPSPLRWLTSRDVPSIASWRNTS